MLTSLRSCSGLHQARDCIQHGCRFMKYPWDIWKAQERLVFLISTKTSILSRSAALRMRATISPRLSVDVRAALSRRCHSDKNKHITNWHQVTWRSNELNIFLNNVEFCNILIQVDCKTVDNRLSIYCNIIHQFESFTVRQFIEKTGSNKVRPIYIFNSTQLGTGDWKKENQQFSASSDRPLDQNTRSNSSTCASKVA